MTYQISFTNPPNPTSVHAGNDVEEAFFDSLCETLNGVHAYSGVHAFAQGFTQDIWIISGASTNGQMTRHRCPVPSRAHTSIKVVFRGRHVQSGSSYGRMSINIYNASGTLIGSALSALQNSGTDQMGTATISGLTLTDDHVRIRCGLVASAVGSYSYCSDIAASWVPLSSVATTKSEQGAIIPIGDNATVDGYPVSAALGYALMTTTNTLLKRLRLLGSISGVSGSSEVDAAYLMPFPYCIISRIHESRDKTRIYWWALAVNGGGSAKDFSVGYGNPESLFVSSEDDQRPNPISIIEFQKQTVPAATTNWYNGYLDVDPSNLASLATFEKFVFLSCATEAMGERAEFGLGENFDGDVLIRSISFWSE